METFLYMTSTGWKSGNPHQIEIWYVEHEGNYYIVAEHRERTHWVQNIRRNPAVTFRIGEGENWPGTARVVEGDDDADLAAAITQKMDDKYGWSAGLNVELQADG